MNRGSAATLLVGATWTILLIVFMPDLLALREVARGSGTVPAHVTSYDPFNHGNAEWVYSVDDKTYGGGESGSSLRPGDVVEVHYALTRPWISTRRAPRGAFRDALLGLVVLMAFTGMAVPIIVFSRGPGWYPAVSFLTLAIIMFGQVPQTAVASTTTSRP